MRINRDFMFWPIVDAVKRRIDGLNQKEAYHQIQAEMKKSISQADLPSRYTYKSKIYQLAKRKQPEIERDLKKAREYGLGVNQCLLIARGKKTFDQLVNGKEKAEARSVSAERRDSTEWRRILETVERIEMLLASVKASVKQKL